MGLPQYFHHSVLLSWSLNIYKYSVLLSLLRGQVAEKFEKLSQYSFYIGAIYSVIPFNAVKLIKK